MKQTVEETAYDYATNKTKFRKDVLKEVDAETYVSRHADSMEDFQCGAEWQSKQSPWISVNERLPEESGYYFVTDGAVVEKVYFFKKWNKFAEIEEYPHLFYDEGVIKAWFPIPSFDEILESNRDVLERIKEKGD
mgnify:CR=1 FL=1|jgi:hypothetical protein